GACDAIEVRAEGSAAEQLCRDLDRGIRGDREAFPLAPQKSQRRGRIGLGLNQVCVVRKRGVVTRRDLGGRPLREIRASICLAALSPGFQEPLARERFLAFRNQEIPKNLPPAFERVDEHPVHVEGYHWIALENRGDGDAGL